MVLVRDIRLRLRHRHVVVGFLLLLIPGEEEEERRGGTEDLVENDRNFKFLGDVGGPVVEEVADDPVWVFFGDEITDGVLEGVAGGFEVLDLVGGDVDGGSRWEREGDEVEELGEIWREFGEAADVCRSGEEIKRRERLVWIRRWRGPRMGPCGHGSITTSTCSSFNFSLIVQS